MKLKITPEGIWLDGQRLGGISQVDIENINPTKSIRVLLHLDVDEVDVQYHSYELMRSKKLIKRKGEQLKDEHTTNQTQ